MKNIVSALGKISTGVISLLVLSVSKAFAASTEIILPEFGPSGDLLTWIKGVLNLVIGLSGLVSVVILIAAGYMFITANGNEDQIGKATKTLTYAIIGLVICLISVLIVQFVLSKVIGV